MKPEVRPSERTLGFRVIGGTTSAIPDVLYPPDPAVLRAIHEFDPNVVSLFCKIAYQNSSGGVVVFGYHALGSHRPSPNYVPEKWTQRVLMPAAGPLTLRPTHKDLDIRARHEKKGHGYPGYGAYLPFDWRVYWLLREMYQEWTAKQIVAYAERKQEEQTAIPRQQAEERAEYAEKFGGVRKHVDNIDKSDIQKLIARETEARKPKPTIVVP